MNCYPFIEAEKAGRRNVSRACVLLKVSRAAFYQHLAGPSQREQADAELTGQIRAVHQDSKGRYGAPAGACRAAPPRPPALPQAGGPADAVRRAARKDAEAVAQDHHR